MQKTIILAGDVSKGYSDFVLIDASKKVLEKPFRLDDNPQGHRQLLSLLRAWKKAHKADRVLFALESTGGYEDNWIRTARTGSASSFTTAFRINPRATHHEYRAQGRSSVDDGVSALTIAGHVAKNLDSFLLPPKEEAENLKEARSLARHILGLSADCTAQKNSLQKLLYQYMPGIVACIPSSWASYFLEALRLYSGKRGLQQAASQGFKQLSRVPKGKAEEIHKALAECCGPRDTPELVVAVIQSKAAMIQGLKTEIDRLEKLLCDMSPVSKEQVALLCSIKGMGEVSAHMLLIFIGDHARFEDSAAMAAFFGVQPRSRKSGDGNFKTFMSKQGSPLVRRELYLIAFRLLSRDAHFRAIYAKCKARGMKHDAALGVLMHKLLRVVYGLLKTGSVYDPQIDKANQEKKPAVEGQPKPAKPDPARRFQPESLDAPISRRQSNKRKKSHEPQAAVNAESTGSS